MKLPKWRRPLAMVAVTALAAGLTFGLSPATPAFADDRCKPKDGDTIKPQLPKVTAEDLGDKLPWPQAQLGTDRLKPLATGKGVTVAVLDSGVDAGHPLLDGKVLEGKSYVDIQGKASNGGAADFDCNGHGTEVAGLIAGDTAENGFAGLAPGVTILPIRVSVQGGDAEAENDKGESNSDGLKPSQFADAVRWAVDQGAQVLNMSLKYTYENADIADAIQYAISKGRTVVAAAGNGKCELDPKTGEYGSTEEVWPAKYSGVIGVGAVDKNIVGVESSDCGKWVDVVAPGTELITTLPGKDFTNQFGATSGATAFVSATAALLYQQHPDWSAEDVAAQIMATASPVTGAKGDIRYGYGLIDPYRALTESQMSVDPTAMADLKTPELDAAAVAERDDFAGMESAALWVALAAAGVFAGALLGVGALRRGRKRAWRISRVNRAEQLETFDDGDPISLYQGIKGLKH